METILSLQSWVSYGHVGNAAAVFPLQRAGAEVLAVNTVQFSNHTGYGEWTGQALPGAAVQDLVAGIAARNVLPTIDAVLSGYLGDPAVIDAVLDAVGKVRAANPRALYCCDPVIGDTGPGIYVRPGVLEAFRTHAIPTADVLTPNHFELATLTGQVVVTLAQTVAAAHSLRRRMRPGAVVLITSLAVDDTPADAAEMVAVADDRAWRFTTPRLPISVNGAGDVTAALFLLHLLRTGRPDAALSMAGNAIYGLLRITHQAGRRELAIVQAQDEFVQPSTSFHANPC